jgi:hypothetical protein
MARKIAGKLRSALLSAADLDIVCIWQKHFAVPYATWWKKLALATSTVACATGSTKCAFVAMANTIAWNAAKPAT